MRRFFQVLGLIALMFCGTYAVAEPLVDIFKANAKRGSFRAEGNTIFVYDVIVGSDAEAEFWGGVSPEAFAKALAAIMLSLSGIASPFALSFASSAAHRSAVAASHGRQTIDPTR